MRNVPGADPKQRILDTIAGLVDDKTLTISEDTALIGDGSALDSMKLVELCLALEDMASELGFAFDWTSETAMSRSRSMFRTAGALANEFVAQGGRRE
jgi:acyl carrier protein